MSYDVKYVRDNFHYDHETGVLSWAKRKQGRKIGKPVGNLDKDGYLYLTLKKGSNLIKYAVHRLCFIHYHGYVPDVMVDHENLNKSDNRIINLREATNADNMRNVGKQAHNTSGIKGVSFHKHTNKWRANIKVNGKHIHLGVFECPAVASFAYQIAADKYHGKFARAF
jgi:hypothetical protein